MFNFFKRKKQKQKKEENPKDKIKGVIRYYGLVDWWIDELTKEERDKILTRFTPLTVGIGNNESMLIHGECENQKEHPAIYLGQIVPWFNREDELPLMKKLVNKVFKLWDDKIHVMDAHFFIVI
jgi:hypothetical protein